MRLVLRPGAHVLRRGDGDLQVGLDPRRALVLPPTEEVRSTLRTLACAAACEDCDPRILQLLHDRELLVEQAALVPPRRPVTSTLSPAAMAALAREVGDGAPVPASNRARQRLLVLPFGDGARGWADAASALASTAGVGVVPAGRRSPRATLGLLLGTGEPDRALVDEWMRQDVPHLLLRLREGALLGGPLVVPGQTACLRCTDAHLTDRDPSWPLLLTQYVDAAAGDRADGAPEPVDPLLQAIGVAWAVRQLASYADGTRPTSWSATLRLGPELEVLESHTWLRHPCCGCAWA